MVTYRSDGVPLEFIFANEGTGMTHDKSVCCVLRIAVKEPQAINYSHLSHYEIRIYPPISAIYKNLAHLSS